MSIYRKPVEVEDMRVAYQLDEDEVRHALIEWLKTHSGDDSKRLDDAKMVVRFGSVDNRTLLQSIEVSYEW